VQKVASEAGRSASRGDKDDVDMPYAKQVCLCLGTLASKGGLDWTSEATKRASRRTERRSDGQAGRDRWSCATRSFTSSRASTPDIIRPRPSPSAVPAPSMMRCRQIRQDRRPDCCPPPVTSAPATVPPPRGVWLGRGKAWLEWRCRGAGHA
jgi:hypothetical protein